MNVFFIFLILIIMLIFCILILKRNKGIAFIFTVGIIVVGIISGYLFYTPFRRNVDMLFNNKRYHEYRIQNIAYEIPLPPKTIFLYRSSDTQAKYMTKTDRDNIISFYNNLCKENANIDQASDTITILRFPYKNNNATIEIKKKSESLWELLIDIEL